METIKNYTQHPNRISKISHYSAVDYFFLKEKEVQQSSKMLFGTLLHAFLLENKEYEAVETNEINEDGSLKATFVKKNNINTNTQISQVWSEYFKQIKIICEVTKYIQLFTNVEQAVEYSFNCSSLEFTSVYKNKYYEANNLFLRGHCDAFNYNYVLDIKTTAIEEDSYKMRYNFIKNGYIQQLFLYKQGLLLQNKVSQDAKLLILAISNDINIPVLQLYSFTDDLILQEKARLLLKLEKIHNLFCYEQNIIDKNIIIL